jgi:hypothetical protein
MPFSFLTITDLTAFDIGTDITLNDTTANRIFRIDHSSDLFSSIESGSSLKMKIHSIRPVGQSTEVEIQGPGILFNDAGNMESVIIEGTVSAYRKSHETKTCNDKDSRKDNGVLLSFYIMSFAAVGIILLGSVLIAILFYIGIGGGG